MGIKYIINNNDNTITNQFVNGGLSATTLSATTITLTSGVTSGYVLTSDGNGKGTWTSPSSIISGATGTTGSGTTNYVSKWTTSSNLGDSQIFDNGTNVGIGTNNPLTTLHVNGKATIQGDVDVFGNVNVIGTATTLNTETVQTRDNKILLNYSGTNVTAVGGGISVLSANTIYTSGLTELITDINGDWNSNVGLNITGRTSDSSSNGLTVKNSGGTDNFVVRNDGNVGIGTSNPNAKLDVVGNMTVSGTSPTNVRVRIGSGTAHLGDVYGANLAAVNNNGNGNIEVSTDLTGGTASLSLSTSFVNQVSITKFGPNYAGSLDGILNANSLHIRNTTYSAYGNVLFPNQNHYFIGENYADTYIGDYGIRHSSKSTITSGPNGEIQFYKAAGSNDGNGFSRRTMVIGDYTNVGGTSGIGDLLTIENNATYTASTFQYRSGAVVHINDMTPYTAVTGNIFKVTKSNVEVLSLSASGNLGINQSSPSEKLDVSGKTKTTTLQVTSGSPQVGYVLTATDTDGNAIWSNPNQSSGSTSVGSGSTAFGVGTSATTEAAFSTGFETQSTGFATASFGKRTQAIYEGSFATGSETLASGAYSSSWGIETSATTSGSTSVGYRTIAESDYQSVFGVYNSPTPSEPGSFIIGNGTDELSRSNLLKAYQNEVKVYSNLITNTLESESAVTFSGSVTVVGNDILVKDITLGEGSGSILGNLTIGKDSLLNNTTGSELVSIGTNSLLTNTIGEKNVSIGYDSLKLNNDGSYNVSIGYDSLSLNDSGIKNTAVGMSSLKTNVVGSNNTAIGYQADVSSSGLTNATAIGNQSVVSLSNSLVLGRNDVNVGIGTSSPSEKLDVIGKTKTTTLQVTSGATTGYILTSDSSGNGTWQAPVRAMTYLLGHDSVSPSDSNTYYIGSLFVLAPVTSSQDSRRITVQRSGTITDVGIMTTIGGTLGSGELSTFTINNVTSGTSSTITTGATHSGDSNINYTLSSPLTVTKNDKIEVRWVTPVWVTNPTTVRQMINVVLSY